MRRIDIGIDDDLIAAATDEFEVRTEREAVDLALRRAVGPPQPGVPPQPPRCGPGRGP
ncbi:type II toxin-antitoxin system VapB family antitoxin [Nocardiopsis suaedae]|uniref:Type II toxin-antitoxin system VapB family antitoxin n=1 Tax=Nocardiopsis suaedae TaxID=3018444 RepID=A0ABT4TE73_9ACTN|nr:type II toxin-antitoxin system VapB family antitoxin [Nocardiopsis suaedae]MDA2803005.1 type II toxin-antitoxin system VapB family antitoxin [Nocardiopsis suaedae]